MQTDVVVLTISSFAGRDVAVGLISPRARCARVFWVAEARLEDREIPSYLWPRVEFEASVGQVPRRLPPGSAVATALFGNDRRALMHTEFVSRFAMGPRPSAALPDSMDDLLVSLSVDVRDNVAPAGTGDAADSPISKSL